MQTLNQTMEKSIEVFSEASDIFIEYADKISILKEQLETEKLSLAVLGQFKRGKSSLINALLGGSFLPIAALPLTALPTQVSFGNTRTASVTFTNGHVENKLFNDDKAMSSFLSEYVTEEQNPQNKKSIKSVEITYPSDFLSKGIVLIDTPGIGSTFRHNTDTVMEFIDKCDAALFVLSVDPPITENELEFLKYIQKHISKLFFVLNKIDYLSMEDTEKVHSFLKKVLTETLSFADSTTVFKISAKNAIKAKNDLDPVAFEKSGVPFLEKELELFFKNGKKEVLREAVHRKFLQVLDEAVLQASLRIKTLEMPLEELKRKRGELECRLASIKGDREYTFGMLNIDKKQAADFCETRIKELKKKTSAHFGKILDAICAENDNLAIKDNIEEIIVDEIPFFFSNEFTTETKLISDKVESILAKYSSEINLHIDAVRFLAASIFDLKCEHIATDIKIKMKRLPYWENQTSKSTLIFPADGIFDVLMPASIKKKRIMERASKKLETLITQNLENMRWSILQNIETTFREFRNTAEDKISKTIDSIILAITSAEKIKEKEAQIIARETDCLNRLLVKVSSLFVFDSSTE